MRILSIWLKSNFINLTSHNISFVSFSISTIGMVFNNTINNNVFHNVRAPISFRNNIGKDGSGSHNEINYSNTTLGKFVESDPNSIIQNERFQYKIFLFRKRIKRLKQIKNLLLKIKLKLQFLNG
jgi:hypothetical protein